MEFPRLVNVELLKNPLNWVTVLLMLVIFTFFANVIVGYHGQLNAAAAQK